MWRDISGKFCERILKFFGKQWIRANKLRKRIGSKIFGGASGEGCNVRFRKRDVTDGNFWREGVVAITDSAT